MTRTLLRRGILAAIPAVAVAATAALAQPGPGMGPGPGGGGPMGGGPGMMGGGMMGGGPGMMGGWNTTTYLDRLKERLSITEKQQEAWKAYADTVSGIGEQMQALHQTMWESMPTASWEERQTQMNTMFEARQQAAKTVHEAALTLMPALTPEQQKQAENILPGLGGRFGMWRHRRR